MATTAQPTAMQNAGFTTLKSVTATSHLGLELGIRFLKKCQDGVAHVEAKAGEKLNQGDYATLKQHRADSTNNRIETVTNTVSEFKERMEKLRQERLAKELAEQEESATEETTEEVITEEQSTEVATPKATTPKKNTEKKAK